MRKLAALARRPIADDQRRAAFLVTVAVILIAAAGLMVIPGGELPSTPTAPVDSGARAIPPMQSSMPSVDLADVGAATPRAATRRFLREYLRYVYRAGPPPAIAAPGLVDRLASEARPRSSPADRQRRPAIVKVKSRSAGPGQAWVSARIRDGSTVYSIELGARLISGRWLIASIGGD
jgi:hypothetical protein